MPEKKTQTLIERLMIIGKGITERCYIREITYCEEKIREVSGDEQIVYQRRLNLARENYKKLMNKDYEEPWGD